MDRDLERQIEILELFSEARGSGRFDRDFDYDVVERSLREKASPEELRRRRMERYVQKRDMAWTPTVPFEAKTSLPLGEEER